jgi:steroid delta-isomerase-like uncharacterized protein
MADSKQVIARFFEEVWNRGDVDAVDRYLASAYTIYHDPGDAWHGQTLDVSGFKHRLVTSRAPFPDQRFEIVHAVNEGDRVAVAWTWRGTHQGDLPGFPASARVITLSGMTLYSFDDARISGHWQVVDRLSLVLQLRAPNG